MEINRDLIEDRPNGWNAKPAISGHLLGVVLVITLWSVFGLAFLAFLLSDPEEVSQRGQTFGLVLLLVVLGFSWGFFGMHARSLLMLRSMTREMAHKRFEGMRPDEVIALVEEQLARQGLPYQRLDRTGGMPREYVPYSMRYLREIFEMEAVGTRIVIQPYSHGDDSRGVPAYTPVFLGPLADDNRTVVGKLMRNL